MAGLRTVKRHEGRVCGLHAVVILLLAGMFFAASPKALFAQEGMVLRITDWKTGTLYAEAPARENSHLSFGWIHSWEKIPWNEYYHIDAARQLVLDAITFPAFGAGIPENKGRVCYIKDGLIHMEEISQIFKELVWLNSHSATRDITLDGALITRGSDLPQHTRLRLAVEKR